MLASGLPAPSSSATVMLAVLLQVPVNSFTTTSESEAGMATRCSIFPTGRVFAVRSAPCAS